MQLIRVLVLAAVLVPAAAVAQNASTPPADTASMSLPLRPDDLPAYCIHAYQVYSVGSAICVGKTGYVCLLGGTEGADGPNPARAYWSARTVKTKADEAKWYVAPRC